MAKRFTDTNKYKKPFFRYLPAAYKLFWDYLYHDCDHAGIWIVDMEIAQLYIGRDALIDKDTALQYFNEGEERIVEIDRGTKWFIVPFIEFQYGTLSKSNNIWKSIQKSFEKYNLYEYLTFEITEYSDTISSKRNRVSQKLREKIFIEDGLVCQYCQEQKDINELVVDHIVPLHKGGSKEKENLTTACKRCNSHKTDIDPEEFLNKGFPFLNPSEKLKEAIKTLKAPFNPLQGGKEKDKDKDINYIEEYNNKRENNTYNIETQKNNTSNTVKHLETQTVDVEKSVNNREKFEQFWKEYPGKKTHSETEWLNFLRVTADSFEVVDLLLPELVRQKEYNVERFKLDGFSPHWPSLMNWIDRRQWELILPEIKGDNEPQPSPYEYTQEKYQADVKAMGARVRTIEEIDAAIAREWEVLNQ